jgi:UDPglucose 6-dehydrogenase
MVKYFTNVQLAARVVLSSELYQICCKLNELGLDIEYDDVKEIASLDKRLGNSHMSVPGSDGIIGSRGHCFPKDLSSIIYKAEQIGIEPKLLKSIRDKNLELVPPEHRDWEKMVGRAFRKRNN